MAETCQIKISLSDNGCLRVGHLLCSMCMECVQNKTWFIVGVVDGVSSTSTKVPI